MIQDGDIHLTSERLSLEPLTQAHAEEMLEGLKDAALYEFIPDEPPADLTALRSRYGRLESRQSPDGKEAWLNWVVRSRVDDACLGYVQATVDPGAGTALIAYLIFRASWGRGYAREALAAVLPRLFMDFGLTLVDALIDTRNKRSMALVEALGFRRVAFIADANEFKGARSAEYRYRLIRPPGRELGR